MTTTHVILISAGVCVVLAAIFGYIVAVMWKLAKRRK